MHTAPALNRPAADLCQIATVESMTLFQAAFGKDGKRIARAMRWYLQGLSPDLAIRKVQIDTEVAAALR